MNIHYEMLRKEVWRKVIHIFFHVSVPILVYQFRYKEFKITFLVLSLLFLGLDFYRIHGGGFINNFVKKIFGEVIRSWEYKRLSASSFSLISLSIVILLFPKEIFALSSLYLGCADPAATIARAWSKRFEYPGVKSLEGLTAFILTSIIITITFNQFNPEFFDGFNIIFTSVIAALCGGIAETLAVKYLDDNFVVPIASAVGLWLVML